MSRVVLVAPSRLALDALQETLGREPHLAIVSRATHLEAALRPPAHSSGEVAVVAVDEVAALRRAMAARDDDTRPIPLVVLVPAEELEDAAGMLAAGVVRAVLPSHAAGREILAAIESTLAGLVTVVPEALAGVGRPPRRVVSLAPAGGLVPLSPREREILALVADGLGNKIVAARLGISEHTVKTHVTSIFTKLGAESRAEAVAIGARVGALML